MPEEQVGVADMVMCDCPVCEKKRGNASSVREGNMHDYSSEPRGGWRVRRTRDEEAMLVGNALAVPAPTFGVELETTIAERTYRAEPIYDGPPEPDRWGNPVLYGNPYAIGQDAPTEQQTAAFERDYAAWREARNEYRIRIREMRARGDREWAESGNLTANEAISLAAPRGLWHAKHDGSVSGPEFASQPCTLAYWRAQRGHIVSMMKGLLHGGVRSHDGDRAGLHVNIGTDAFASAESRAADAYCDAGHLSRFAALIFDNPRWATRMAMRTHHSAAQWAKLSWLDDPAVRNEWAAEVARRGYAYQDRYYALNAGNRGRIEFRLPRGTLRVDRFYAKLEWVAAMIEYTRDASRDIHVSPFIRWVDQSGEYPALVAFLQERFAGRFAAVSA